MIKGVIFDLDGVILDSMDIWEHLGERYLDESGIKAEPKLSVILEQMTTWQSAEYLIKNYDLERSAEEIVKGFHRLLQIFYEKEVQLKPGVKRCLNMLSDNGIPYLIATSNDRILVERALKRLNIYEGFQKILTCSELNTDKTKPDIFMEAAGYLSVEPDEAAVFEDSYYAMETASKAGFHVFGVYDRCNKKWEKKSRQLAEQFFEDFTKFTIESGRICNGQN